MAKDLLHKLGKDKLEKPRDEGVLKRPAAMTPVKTKRWSSATASPYQYCGAYVEMRRVTRSSSSFALSP